PSRTSAQPSQRSALTCTSTLQVHLSPSLRHHLHLHTPRHAAPSPGCAVPHRSRSLSQWAHIEDALHDAQEDLVDADLGLGGGLEKERLGRHPHGEGLAIGGGHLGGGFLCGAGGVGVPDEDPDAVVRDIGLELAVPRRTHIERVAVGNIVR
ncbi:hypothetical protein H0H81_007092, partial [Sphagnurus paluster]